MATKKATKKAKRPVKRKSKPKKPAKIIGECHYCHDLTLDGVMARDPYLVWVEDYPGEFEDPVELTWCKECFNDRQEEVA